MLPQLQNRGLYRVVPENPVFYLAKDIKRVGGAEMNKTMFTRMAGAVFSLGGCYAVYNTRASVVLCQEKVQVKSELFLQHSIPLILPILPSFLISAHTHSRIRLVIDIHNDCVFGLYCKMSLCIQIPVCVHAHSLIF